MKKQKFRRLMCFILTAAMVVPVSSTAWARQNEADTTEYADTMTTALIDKMDGVGKVMDVLVKIRGDADTDAAKAEAASFKTDEPIVDKEKNAVIGSLEEIAAKTQAPVLEYLENEKNKGKVEEFESFFIVNAIHVKADKSVIEELSLHPSVEKIDINGEIKRDKPIDVKKDTGIGLFGAGSAPKNEIEWNIKKINADKVWEDYGITGKNVTVGILDSAVDYDHPALRDNFKGYNPVDGSYNFDGSTYKDVVDGHKKPQKNDDKEHGSHCVGIMMGSESDGKGNVFNAIGVAPDAKWINARVFGNNDGESATTEGFLAAAQWMIKPGGDIHNAPSIINNSWGGNSVADPWFESAVESWRKVDILPVFAAGNQRAGEPSPGPYSISNPANLGGAFAVGAVDSKGLLAYFSKRGPSQFPRVSGWKPEISAPGVQVRSAIEDGYAYMSGTSMAAPHVAGVAALLKSADSSLSVKDLESYLTSTAEPRTDGTYSTSPNHGYGYGIVNAYDAVSKVMNKQRASIEGKVVLPSGNEGVETTVTVKETNRSVKTDKKGEYKIMHIEGNWTVEASAYGFKTQEKPVQIVNGQEKVELSFDLEAKAKKTVSGAVKNESTGEPVQGVWVKIVEDSTVPMVQTDEFGKFKLNNVLEGTCTLRVFKDNYENNEQELNITPASDFSNINITLKAETNLIDKEQGLVKMADGEMSQIKENNFYVDGGRNGGAAVRIVPEKKGGIITSVNAKFFNDAYYAGTNTCLLHIVQFDERRRTNFLLRNLEVKFTPGKMMNVPLAHYQIKTDEPFFVILERKKGSNGFYVGVDRSKSSDASFIWQGLNLYQFQFTEMGGALLMSANMAFEKNAEDISISIDKPVIYPIIPTDNVIKGSLKASDGKAIQNRIVAVTLPGGERKMTMTDVEGKFEVGVKRSLLPGAEITAVSQDKNGISSEPVVQYVRNRYDKLENLVLFTEGKLNNIEDAALKAKMKEQIDIAKGNIEAARNLEKVLETTAKEIKELQVKISDSYQSIKNLSLNIYPNKKALMEAIEAVELEFKTVKISYHGNDVPSNLYWVTPKEWNNMNNAIIDAKIAYDKDIISDEEINTAVRRLNEAKAAFDAVKQLGKKKSFIIDERYKDGEIDGEAGSVLGLASNMVKIKVQGGRLIQVWIADWRDSKESRDAIEASDYLTKICENNSLDIDPVRGYEAECYSIVEAIKNALGKLLKEDYQTETDKTPLLEKINKVRSNLASTLVSSKGDGSDIEAGKKWVTESDAAKLRDAVTAAENASKIVNLTKEQMDKHILELEIAERNFNSSKRTGSDVVNPEPEPQEKLEEKLRNSIYNAKYNLYVTVEKEITKNLSSDKKALNKKINQDYINSIKSAMTYLDNIDENKYNAAIKLLNDATEKFNSGKSELGI